MEGGGVRKAKWRWRENVSERERRRRDGGREEERDIE